MSSSSFPSELNSVVADFHTGLCDVESALEPLVDRQSRTALVESAEKPIEKAKVDVAAAFALNSLVWMWARTKGENPKECGVKQEMDRVKAAMLKLREIQDKEKRPKVDTPAAKRMVKSGLWKPKKDDGAFKSKRGRRN